MSSLVRFKYDPETSQRLSEAEKLLDLPRGGHDTRNLSITPDGKHVLIAVGSESNISPGEAPMRAAVTICDLDGKNARQFATGLRNPVGLAIEPVTGKPWVTVNERDELGDDLPPDYFTSIQDWRFLRWPWHRQQRGSTRLPPQQSGVVLRAISRRASSAPTLIMANNSRRVIRGSPNTVPGTPQPGFSESRSWFQ
jgi:glucose/arabinose dehydrogenase